MEGASDEQCYHFRRARRACQVGEGLRVRPGNGRDDQEIVRLRARRDRLMGVLAAPARQMRLRVGSDGLPPLPRAERDGRRLRDRSRFQDAQARRGPRPQDRQARRAVPRGAAGAGRGHRGARARCRVRGRAGFGAGAGRRARRRRARQAEAFEVPAQARGSVYDERNAAGQRRNRWTGDFWAWVAASTSGTRPPWRRWTTNCERVREADAAKAALEAKVKSLAQQPRWKADLATRSNASRV